MYARDEPTSRRTESVWCHNYLEKTRVDDVTSGFGWRHIFGLDFPFPKI